MEFSEDNLSKELGKVMANFSGIMERFLKVNGKVAKKMDLEFGNAGLFS